MDRLPACVFDIGSSRSKIGFAGNHHPQFVLPSAVGLPSKGGVQDIMDYSIGEEALRLSDLTRIRYLKRLGQVEDWDTMEKFLLRCIYHHLRATPDDHHFLMTEAPLMTRPKDRERLAEILFETLSVAGLAFVPDALLSLPASWVARSPEERTTTGLVIDVGESLTSLTPVVEGVTMVSDAVRFPITGRTVTEYLEQLLWEREADVIPRDQSHAIVEAIKQRFCYTAPNMVRELGHYETQPHMYIKQHRGLYDNNRQKEFRVDVGPERFLAPEIFFQPDLVAMSSSSLPETVVALIQASSIEVRRGLYKNIVLSGGSSLFKDFGRRLERDINRIIPAKMVIRPEVKVVSHWMQEHAVWFGASMLGSTPDFYEACTSKADYYEHGPGICRPVMGVGA